MIETLEPVAAYALWADSYPPRAHNAVMLAEQRAVLSLLPKSLLGTNTLDVGCGTGRYCLIAREMGATVTGFDLSTAMLRQTRAAADCACASVTALPVRDAAADLVICALTVGHVRALPECLRELHRVVRRHGLIVCSDFHPIGESLGWQRTFKANGTRFAVVHHTHTVAAWHEACAEVGLCVAAYAEARLDPNDISPNANFDPRALDVPVAHAFALRPKLPAEVR